MFDAAPAARRRPTATSSFGVSRRESHDASKFYARFTAPDLSADATIAPHRAVNDIFPWDAREMGDEVPDNSVALVVTSPPYFAGKEYEQALGEGHVPGTYLDYLQMLEDVFSQCVSKLEPGGRIAVNVANLGRRPYRSLSSDVVHILQDKLRLLLRGEIIWQKAEGAAANCAWGSFQSPANPVLRDLTERVIVASKGRFDRAVSKRERDSKGLPSEGSLSRDHFMAITTDVWEFAPERASRAGHPAPFPVELPERLIHLYTYYGDLVLDPFLGSGSTAVAAARTGRHYAGYETDHDYVARAWERIRHEGRRDGQTGDLPRVVVPAVPPPADPNDDFQSRALRDGRAAKDVAEQLLVDCGFRGVRPGGRLRHGVEVTFRALDAKGRQWLFDVSGAFSSARPGLRRTENLWKALGKAAVLHAGDPDLRLVLLTTDVPAPGSAGDAALRAVCGPGRPVAAFVRMLSVDDRAALRSLAGSPADAVSPFQSASSLQGRPFAEQCDLLLRNRGFDPADAVRQKLL